MSGRALAIVLAAVLLPAVAAQDAEVEAAIRRGVEWLVEHQNPDGSWGSARRTKALNIYAPVPGAHHAFRSATTAIAVSGLLDSGAKDLATRAAIDRGEAWLLENLPRLRRATADALYNVWGHGFGVEALARLLAARDGDEERCARIGEVLDQQIDLLARYEVADGGWDYYDFRIGARKPAGESSSFTTATVLVGLYDAERLGHPSPRAVVVRAVESIRRQRQPDFSYLYGEYFRWSDAHEINLPGGSLGRSQVCNVATRIWGDEAVTDAVLETWIERLLVRGGWLDIGRKRPVPHESWFAVAGYFYYYGHYYAARAIELLPDPKRPAYRKRLAAVLLARQEKDGSWFDYPLYDYGHAYGTGLALQALSRCR